MIKMNNTDLVWVMSRLPRDVQDVLNAPVYRGVMLGGGFIRETIAGNPVKDIDLFVPHKEMACDIANHLKAGRAGESRVHITDNAVTLLTQGRIPVQIITRWVFDSPEALLESFDFTVCRAVISNVGGVISGTVDNNFYCDLAARRLVYTYPNREEAPGGSMMRVRKFLSRGYNIQPQSLAGVISRIAGGVKNFESIDEKERSFVIAGLLSEVDPLCVVDGIEFRED